MSKPRPLPYYGGKAKGRGAWITSLLPWSWESLYCEPFCGMGHVWSLRDPVKREILNDLNERIHNWWTVCRDQPDEFARLLDLTPHSRREYQWSHANLDNTSIPKPMRALAFYTVILQGVIKSDVKTGWRLLMNTSTGSIGRWDAQRVNVLARRLVDVQLECCDGLDLMRRLKDQEHAVIYVDQPYESAETSAYLKADLDRAQLYCMLLAQRGKVAVSGYGKEWDHLGWQRHEHRTSFRGLVRANGEHHASPGPRTEVLWTNYEVA